MFLSHSLVCNVVVSVILAVCVIHNVLPHSPIAKICFQIDVVPPFDFHKELHILANVGPRFGSAQVVFFYF